MTRHRIQSIGLVCLFTVASLNAQTTPSTRGVALIAAVAKAGNSYAYAYTVTNNSASTTGVARLQLDIGQPQGGVVEDATGLPAGQSFATDIAILNLTDPNATQFVASTADAPNGWIVGVTVNATVMWGAATLDAMIEPGQSLTGFTVYSKGLPAIRAFSAETNLDVDSLPLAEPTPETFSDYVASLVQLRKQGLVSGVTIGPSAPPANFQPVVFLQTIQTYKEQALALGWITNTGIANSLDVKLNAALAALQRGNKNEASNQLNAFLNEVSAQAGKHLSPEAVALLQANTQYLLAHM